MKILTLNFLTCAVRNCKSSPLAFPLHVRDAELEIAELEFQPLFLRNVLPRLDLEALQSVVGELGLKLPEVFGGAKAPATRDVEMGDAPQMTEGAVEQSVVTDTENSTSSDYQDEDLKKLHRVLIETQIDTGLLVCGNCGHEYKILEGIPNFLLPPHLV